MYNILIVQNIKWNCFFQIGSPEFNIGTDVQYIGTVYSIYW